MKTCVKCKKLKPFSDFHKITEKMEGRVNRCKDCVKAYKADYSAKKKADPFAFHNLF